MSSRYNSLRVLTESEVIFSEQEKKMPLQWESRLRLSLEISMLPTSGLLALISRVIFPHNKNSRKKENHNGGSYSLHFFVHRSAVCNVSQALKVLNIF